MRATIVKCLTACSLLLATIVAGCATQDISKRVPDYCNVYSVELAGEPQGTAFTVAIDDTSVFLITAAHVISDADIQKLSIRSSCSTDSVRISDIAVIPGKDIALLFAESPLPNIGFHVRSTPANCGEAVEVPNFSGLGKVSNKFRGKLIPSNGKMIGYDDQSILITLDVMQKGGSGGPILDNERRILGLLTNRVNTNGEYAGVSYGIESRVILEALRNFVRSGRH